jgi:hypothetical protein
MGIKFPVILQLSDKGDNVSTGVALSEQNYSLSSRVHRLLDGTIHGQAAWIHALGGVERKRNTRLEPTPPPSGVLTSGLSSPAGVVSFESQPLRCC